MNKINKLKEKIKKLEDENEKLKQEKNKIEDEKRKVEQEFEKYKTNYPVIKKELPSFVKENIKHEQKKPGQKKGHAGYSRHIPDRIDFIYPLEIDICPDCKTPLGKTQEIRKRIIIDIPLTSNTINTQYEIHRKYCCKCKKIVELEVPNALPNSPFGINLMLFVVFLKINMAPPYNKIQQLLLTMYNLKISEGGLVSILFQIKEEFGDYYKTLEKKMRKEKVKHSDESGWRVDGINNYICP